jgi:hypothetical protein
MRQASSNRVWTRFMDAYALHDRRLPRQANYGNAGPQVNAAPNIFMMNQLSVDAACQCWLLID